MMYYKLKFYIHARKLTNQCVSGVFTAFAVLRLWLWEQILRTEVCDFLVWL